MLYCCNCDGVFEHPESEQKFFKANGWSQPTRCGPCRKAKKAASYSPITLNCEDCKKDHIFSVNAQKHFKEQNWASPIRCFQCRKDHKEKLAAEKLEKAEKAKEEAKDKEEVKVEEKKEEVATV